jgi:hypothetical protein
MAMGVIQSVELKKDGIALEEHILLQIPAMKYVEMENFSK